jgi:hypothetical protein
MGNMVMKKLDRKDRRGRQGRRLGSAGWTAFDVSGVRIASAPGREGTLMS